MKKVILGLIFTVMFGFLGNAQDYSGEPSLDVNYFNYVLSKSNLPHDYKINEVKKLTLEKFKIITNKFPEIKNVKLEFSTLVDVTYADEQMNIIVLALNDGYEAISVIERNGKFNETLIDVQFTKEGNYSYNPLARGGRSIISKNCSKGSNQIVAIGGTIAFAGFFGCLPCPFVGGAVATVAGLMGVFCP
jgi:hypothetical protein